MAGDTGDSSPQLSVVGRSAMIRDVAGRTGRRQVALRSGTTLRVHMPQWQGGNVHDYWFGSQLLAWLAPAADGPIETVPVPVPDSGETLRLEDGLLARAAILDQAHAAKAVIERHRPDRIVMLGGDC